VHKSVSGGVFTLSGIKNAFSAKKDAGNFTGKGHYTGLLPARYCGIYHAVPGWPILEGLTIIIIVLYKTIQAFNTNGIRQIAKYSGVGTKKRGLSWMW
jgi:hypothetical protein